jgi:hypothetical protein
VWLSNAAEHRFTAADLEHVLEVRGTTLKASMMFGPEELEVAVRAALRSVARDASEVARTALEEAELELELGQDREP